MRQFLTESLVDGERSQSKSFSSCARIGRIFSFSASSPLRDRKSGSAGMPRPMSYGVFRLKKKTPNHTCPTQPTAHRTTGSNSSSRRRPSRLSSADPAAGVPDDSSKCQRREAEQLLISSHLEAGLVVIRTALRSVSFALSLHDALPISKGRKVRASRAAQG